MFIDLLNINNDINEQFIFFVFTFYSNNYDECSMIPLRRQICASAFYPVIVCWSLNIPK